MGTHEIWVQGIHGLLVRWSGPEEASRGVQGWAWRAGRLPRRAVQERPASPVEVQGRRGSPRVFRGHLQEVLRESPAGRLRRNGPRQEILAYGMDVEFTVLEVQGWQEEPSLGGAGSNEPARVTPLQP